MTAADQKETELAVTAYTATAELRNGIASQLRAKKSI
jgi:hypothetical protein